MRWGVILVVLSGCSGSAKEPTTIGPYTVAPGEVVRLGETFAARTLADLEDYLAAVDVNDETGIRELYEHGRVVQLTDRTEALILKVDGQLMKIRNKSYGLNSEEVFWVPVAATADY